MEENGQALPAIVKTAAFYSCVVSTVIILVNVLCHLFNYRKPLQQRLMIRIQLILPLFAASCYVMLTDESMFVKMLLTSLREVYEAFVIYTFFSLLTMMLGGERNIIILTSGRPPVLFGPLLLDISDPNTFLYIKRGILQYVWMKPAICLLMIVCDVFHISSFDFSSPYLWLTIVYNLSVTISLYCLAIFWKILWSDLKPFNPVGKFLCVKLIIFASYWQGIIIGLLNAFHLLPESGDFGVLLQNALLCIELIAFAIGHWFSFSFTPFTIKNLPYGKLRFKYALKDIFGIKDLVYDFKLTFYGDYYKDYKHFDSVEAMIAHPSSKGRISRINQGLRYHHNGKQKHWLPQQLIVHQSLEIIHSTSDMTYEPSITSHGGDQNRAGEPSNSSTRAYQPSNSSIRAIYQLSIDASWRGTNSISEANFPSPILQPNSSIAEMLNQDNSPIDYDNEEFEQDEQLYTHACQVINNYNLDQKETKKLLNYPIIDDLIHAHAYGYRVNKLRKERLRNSEESDRDLGTYGSLA